MSKMKTFTIHQFNRMFPNDDVCLDVLRSHVYPEGITCRSCNEIRPHHRLTQRKAYSCDYCGTHVYVLAGTIFEKTTTPLVSWFYAMYLMGQTRCGISAKQLERELGVTYKTAWRMFNKIRWLLSEDFTILSGEVELDETYIGGVAHTRPGETKRDAARSRYRNKSVVAGQVQRGGRLQARYLPDGAAGALVPLARAHIMPGSMVYTDELNAYKHLARAGYQHRRVHHAAKIYVDGRAHVNTLEGFWSLLKNGIRGVYHSVGTRYLQSYVDEYVFRYNHRNDTMPMFGIIESQVRHVRQGRYGMYSPVG
jgi:transposase-like protein